MKLKPLVFLVLVALSAMLLGGCRTATIYNVRDAPVSVVKSEYTLKDVGDAITRAGVALGWQMKVQEPGHIVGTLFIRSHMAQVDINYTKTSYNIEYKDSTNLKYDGTHIHSNYNGWIQNLDNGIRAQLTAL
jgi:hypothetical protein